MPGDSTSSSGAQSLPSTITPAAPPSRSEIERKLSFRSATSPRLDQSPRKKRSPSTVSGNDSDTSLSSAQGHSSIASPILSPSLSSGGGQLIGSLPAPNVGQRQLSAIAERLRGQEGVVEETDEYEEHDEGEDLSDEEPEAAEGQGELERGMEGERVLRSGYLYKKQEKRKVWKKKWFVLRTGKLAYYKDDREYSLSRVMDLRIIHTAAPVKIKKHSFTFGIVTKKRTFLVEASSQSEMDEWVAAISTARRKLTEEGEKRQAQAQAGPGSSIRQVSNPVQNIDTDPSTINPSYTRGGSGIQSSPSQMYSSTGLPPTSPTESTGQPGLISQMSRMGVGSPSQPVGMRPGPPSQPIRSYSSRREPSASSVSSNGADYFPKTPSANQSPQPPLTLSNFPHPHGISSESDGESEMYSQIGTSVGTTKTGISGYSQGQGPGIAVDPARVILSAYLMKRSKGRGRKVWRKRWFYLTSQGLTYTKSHMDTKTLRNIPLTSILDAIDQSSSLDDVDPSSSDSDGPIPARQRSPSTSKFPTSPSVTRQLSTRGFGASSSTGVAFGSGFGGAQPKEGEHTFRLVTAKRNYVLCAPSEEDEIKWLAAVKALLNRERGMSSPVNEMPPRLQGSGGWNIQGQGVPTITEQPPTPGSAVSQGGLAPPIPVEQTSGAGARVMAPAGIGARGRSATYLAKSAVADVERRYHPEQQQT